jgi:RimJ/RimL family protein N-acetyltransferase
MVFMRELKNSEFSSIIQLLNQEKVHCTFAYAVAEGKQPGRIYVDNHTEPKSCLVTCTSGKYLVAGETNNNSFNEFISSFLYNKENHSSYFDIYSSSHDWIIKLDEILGDSAAKLSRQLFEYDYSNLSSLLVSSEMLPEGFELKEMDAALFEKYAREMDPSYNDLWENPNNFASNGFGFCVLKDNEFVSVCNTYYVRQGFAEIDVVTKDKFRGQGFALAACSKFIKYCVENSIKPLWDCDDGNEGSKKLADKLGFKSVETYQMHWWHENKTFVENYLKKFKYNKD